MNFGEKMAGLLFQHELTQDQIESYHIVNRALETLYDLHKKEKELKPKMQKPRLTTLEPTISQIEDYVYIYNKCKVEQENYNYVLDKINKINITWKQHIMNFISDKTNISLYLNSSKIDAICLYVFDKYSDRTFTEMFDEVLDLLFFIKTLS